jgi:uncharacterized protein YlxP (DUF503 family)
MPPPVVVRMVIGLLTLELLIAESQSLKDKRQVLKSLLETTRQRFNVSAAEVDHLDLWQRATIAVACVSKDQVFVDQVLNKVLRTIEGNPRVEVANVDMEFL